MHGLAFVLRDASAIAIHGPQEGLRECDALFGGQPEPVHGLAFVLRDASAGGVPDPQVDLRFGVALFGAGAEVLQLLAGRLRAGRDGGEQRRRQRKDDRAAHERQAPAARGGIPRGAESGEALA